MHRMKIGLIAAGLLLVATALFYVSVTSSLRGAATRDVEERVSRAQRVYQNLSRLSGIDLANLAAGRARRQSVVTIFDKPDVTTRRQAAYTECETLNAGFQKEQRKADIVAILDAGGKVLARDLNPNAEFNEDYRARFPAVAQALKSGQPVKDIWTLQGRMTEVGVAPITQPDGTTVGAILVGYVLSARKAQERHDMLGVQIAYFHAGKVHTSSFIAEGAGENAKEDVGKTQAISAVLFSGAKLADEALQKGAPTEVVHAAIEGKDYAVVASPFPGNFADKTSGVALAASVSDGFGRARNAGMAIVLFGLVGIIVALGASVMTAKRFLGPLDEIEVGVGEIINGNIDFTFKPVGPDFEGLENGLNVMLARLLGREEPSEDAVDEEEEQARQTREWKAEQMEMEAGDGTAPPNVATALGQESEPSYYTRVYSEYVNALASLGKPAHGVSVQAFLAKLRLTEAGLREKWSCKVVRFQVLTRGADVILRAVRIG